MASPCPTVFWLPFLLQLQDRYSHGVQQETIFATAKREDPVGLTRQCEDSDLLLVVDNRGTPIGVLDDSAQQAEVKLANLTLSQ